MKTGIKLIAAERERQMSEESYTANHDDTFNDNLELASAAACYLDHYVYGFEQQDALYCARWPWNQAAWKPSSGEGRSGKIRDLVKVGALIAAEIDRLQRSNS